MEGFDVLRTLQAVFGIGLVVFVHELGHYIAARLCGVRVEVFSLGFGPSLLSWRRGPTVYQVAIVPLGGYCRMAGAEERRIDGKPPQPDELPSKTVGQRFVIYAAGVAMNVAFVLVMFPILFRVGVPFIEPRIGDVLPGGPAWMARIQPGEEVLSVNGNRIFEFSQIRTEVALGDPERTEIVLREPSTGTERTVELVPERDPSMGLYSIGVGPAIARDAGSSPLIEVREDSAAWQAGLRTGMALVSVVGGDPWLDVALQYNQAVRAGGPVELTVSTEEGARALVVEPRSQEVPVRRVGISPPTNHVAGLRESPDVQSSGLLVGDRLLSVEGTPVLRRGDFQRALRRHVGSPARVEVLRDGESLELSLPALTEDRIDRLVADLAIGVDMESTMIVVQPGEAAARAGLRDGDVVREIDGAPTAVWQDVFDLVKGAGDRGQAAQFSIGRTDPGGGPSTYPTIEVRPEMPTGADYGIGFRIAEYIHRADSTAQAVSFGFYSSWKLVSELWLTLKGLVTADVPAENLGGIITIGRVSYAIAEGGWTKFFFFLCFLSMNLAFVNLLPIPVLDGGHLFFLIVEKIKGSPVSERVLGYSQMVGVVLILSLMIYVTYNDLMRLFPGG